jgi:hypothetical protein
VRIQENNPVPIEHLFLPHYFSLIQNTLAYLSEEESKFCGIGRRRKWRRKENNSLPLGNGTIL